MRYPDCVCPPPLWNVIGMPLVRLDEDGRFAPSFSTGSFIVPGHIAFTMIDAQTGQRIACTAEFNPSDLGDELHELHPISTGQFGIAR